MTRNTQRALIFPNKHKSAKLKLILSDGFKTAFSFNFFLCVVLSKT